VWIVNKKLILCHLYSLLAEVPRAARINLLADLNIFCNVNSFQKYVLKLLEFQAPDPGGWGDRGQNCTKTFLLMDGEVHAKFY